MTADIRFVLCMDGSITLMEMGSMPRRHATHMRVCECIRHLRHFFVVVASVTSPGFERRAGVYGRKRFVCVDFRWQAWHMRRDSPRRLGSTLSVGTYSPHNRQIMCSTPVLDMHVTRGVHHLSGGLGGGFSLHGIQVTDVVSAASM